VTYRAKEHYRDPKVAAAYDGARFESRKGRFVDRRERSLIRDAIRRSGVGPGASILDAPCGTGRVARMLAIAGYAVTGVDVSEAMLDRATAGFAGLPATARPRLLVADAEALPFPDGAFDLAVSLRLFGHLPRSARIQVLREFRRVAGDGVIVAYYHRGSIQGLLRRRRRRGMAWHPVTLGELDAELREAGLRRVQRRFLLPFVSETVVVLARRA
jgi:ubiquinone/menaquinone biosynthesis C-methylase UbiE